MYGQKQGYISRAMSTQDDPESKNEETKFYRLFRTRSLRGHVCISSSLHPGQRKGRQIISWDTRDRVMDFDYNTNLAHHNRLGRNGDDFDYGAKLGDERVKRFKN